MMPTPFDRDGGVDLLAFDKLLGRQAAAGCPVAVGTRTGEGASLTAGERRLIVGEASLVCGGRVKVYAGVSAREGEGAIEAAVNAAESGADGLILEDRLADMTGFCTLVRRLMRETGLPVAAEREKGRKSLACFPELASFSGSGQLPDGGFAVAERFDAPFETARLCAALLERADPPPLVCYGDEGAFLCPAFGALGVFSRFAALEPDGAVRLFSRRRSAGDADALWARAGLFSLLWGEEGVPALKWRLHRAGLCLPDVRLPLAEWDESRRESV